jgi:dUTP pyrophosphatase
LYSVEEIVIPPFGRALIPTGLVLQFDEGFEIQIRPKSGLAINQGLTVLNTPGTVDQGYTGEIQVIIFNTNDKEVKISEGMKVAQGVLCPVQNGKFVSVEEITDIQNKDRGDKGFGSTGI